MILMHLLRGEPITPRAALDLYGCLCLGARIYDLREQGWPIKTEMVARAGKRYAEYRLSPTWEQKILDIGGRRL